MTIAYDDFARIDIRAGTVRQAESFPEARTPAVKLWIDFGPGFGELRSSAQITGHYEPGELVGRQVCAVVNLPEKQIGPFMSQCLVLGFTDTEGAVVLIAPHQPVPDGARLC